jgi:hypothetical protein
MPNMAKLLLFPKPVPAPIHTVKQTITLSCGAETYTMTIHAQVQRVTAQPTDRSSPDFQHGRELESGKLAPAAQGGDPDTDRTSGLSPGTDVAELSCMCSPNGVMNVITAVDAAPGDRRKMKYFTIDTENHINVHASGKAPHEGNAGVFSTEKQFADLIGSDSQRLLEIWNRLPGSKAATKFPNRKVATERIWKAIQAIGKNATPPATQEPDGSAAEAITVLAKSEIAQGSTPAAPEPVATVGAPAPDAAATAAQASRKATGYKKLPTSEPQAKVARKSSKTEQAIAMMKRPGGATLKQLTDTLEWQAHTVRGFVAGTLANKMGLTVASTKPAGGERTYSIAV